MKRVVLTGGPGAGKTAVLELLKNHICSHVAILPESASILFGGGFWRLPSKSARTAAQKSIFYVQKQMEILAENEHRWSVAFCDRGSIDALAYWPKSENSFWKELGTSKKKEFARYEAVLHLRTPTEKLGYGHQNPIRTESPAEAAAIDLRIKNIWQDHPGYLEIESQSDFLKKAQTALQALSPYLPHCCKKNRSLSK